MLSEELQQPERRQRKTITDLYDDLEALQSLQEGSPILTDQNFRRISWGLAAYTVVRILANLIAVSFWSRWDVADDAILRPLITGFGVWFFLHRRERFSPRSMLHVWSLCTLCCLASFVCDKSMIAFVTWACSRVDIQVIQFCSGTNEDSGGLGNRGTSLTVFLWQLLCNVMQVHMTNKKMSALDWWHTAQCCKGLITIGLASSVFLVVRRLLFVESKALYQKYRVTLRIKDMAAKAGLHIGLPNVPDDADLDLDEGGDRVKSRGDAHEDSPAKRSKGAPAAEAGGVTMDAIKGLLASALQEQSFSLLQAQQAQINSSLTAFEERQSARLVGLETSVQQQGEEVRGVQGQLQELAQRVTQLESGVGEQAGRAGPDRKHTLVFGGWGANTRKSVLLHQLQQALSGLKLLPLLDAEPFCTGARRSVALCPFKRRAHEAESDTRARMLEIIQVVGASKVEIEGAVRPLWASFSKSPEERGRAALAAVVRKVVQRCAPHRMLDLDVEYPSGRTWMKEDQLSGMGAAPDEVRNAKVVQTKAGAGWLDERTLARWVETDIEAVRAHGDVCADLMGESLRDPSDAALSASGPGPCSQLAGQVQSGERLPILGWNVGGADLFALPKAVRDVLGRTFQKDELVVLQEVPRVKAGWSFQEVAGRRVVSHQAADQWRGTGLWYDTKEWCILRKLGTKKGTWLKLRRLQGGEELWLGTCHLSPGTSVAQFEIEAQDHFESLPVNARTVVFQGDVNTGFTWAEDRDGVDAVAKEGKGHILHKILMERGLKLGVPQPDQFLTPTSRPRDSKRQGQCVDVMSFKGIRFQSWHIHVDSHMKVGTDHEMCESVFKVRIQREHPRHETCPREWTGGLESVEHLDQEAVEAMAKAHTRPKGGHGYKDPDEVKQAFKTAKRSGTAASWKAALKKRKEARKAWEWERLVRASEGEWHSFKALKPRRQEGWDVTFAEAQVGDPHEVIHKHLSEVYKGPELPAAETWTGDIRVFTVEELRVGVSQMKRGKAVGSDLTSTELVLGLMSTPGGEEHLLQWYNRILVTQQIPAKWNEPVLVMLPKIRAPRKAKELRPIAMGSAVSKLFSRLLLNRALPHIAPQTYAQCSGAGRQTADFLFTAIRLFELAREWGNPLVVFKLDLEKAFDNLERGVLLAKLESKLGQGAELNCWRGLLRGTVGLLQTPWSSSRVAMDRGIKQGAVESPTFFAYIAELALADTIETHGWRHMPALYPGLPPEEMLYMDDGLLWNGLPQVVQARAQTLSTQLSKYGLKLNPLKCQLYASTKVTERRFIVLDGVTITAQAQLEVMGITLRVGMSIYELVAPTASRARAKFWELRHIFRARGNMKQRARVMERVIGATALWFICAVPPDKSAMTALNATQLQLMVWLLRFAKTSTETWEDFRKRAFRGARSALHSAGVERWSTLWLRRYWRYAGHRVRASLSPVPPISTEVEFFRTLSWWRWQQKRKKQHAVLHKGHHYARLTVLEQSLDSVAGSPWRDLAYDRRAWAHRENAWVAHMDVPWSSGRQLSIADL
ncbi:unnamed protein product [Symbiodinium sp. CCMP2592]|nr:unnamed protein product [Symbiodinium sp. CCMP2592]